MSTARTAMARFYDPRMYELNIGYTPRFGEVYRDHLGPLADTGRIMELGCGTGAVLLPLARAGATAVGVDGSPDMLGHFARSLKSEPADVADRVSLHEATLPALPAVEPVDAVIMPNDLVSHILSDEDLDLLLHNVRSALKPGGQLALDVSPYDVARLGAGSRTTHYYSDYPGGKLIDVSEWSSYDAASGILLCTMRYEVLDTDAEVESAWHRQLRMYPRRLREVTAAVRLAGFELDAVIDTLPDSGSDNILVAAHAV
ncbi:class I SAM-dependent methyltransferase [Kutzneria sp. NPDC052558]|uniref:class I SAM-dependent methyltransferase n=1 Tax=Kutzneria sp. NPDC052558 TaxID=3364121 RepID=UPI0037C93E21